MLSLFQLSCHARVAPGPLVCEASIINNKIIRPSANHTWLTESSPCDKTMYMHASTISFHLFTCELHILSRSRLCWQLQKHIGFQISTLPKYTNNRLLHDSDYIGFTKIRCQQFSTSTSIHFHSLFNNGEWVSCVLYAKCCSWEFGREEWSTWLQFVCWSKNLEQNDLIINWALWHFGEHGLLHLSLEHIWPTHTHLSDAKLVQQEKEVFHG